MYNLWGHGEEKMTEQKPKPDDEIAEELPCVCGNKDHKAGLIIGKWGSLTGSEPDKIKIQIFEGDEIKSVVVDKQKLKEMLK